MTGIAPVTRRVHPLSELLIQLAVSEAQDMASARMVLALQREPLCFGALRRRAGRGVPQRSLMLALTALQRDGVVERQTLPRPASAPKYALTPLGVSFAELLGALHRWVQCCEGAAGRPSLSRRPAASGTRRMFPPMEASFLEWSVPDDVC